MVPLLGLSIYLTLSLSLSLSLLSCCASRSRRCKEAPVRYLTRFYIGMQSRHLVEHGAEVIGGGHLFALVDLLVELEELVGQHLTQLHALLVE
jgi:hypothetical protein